MANSRRYDLYGSGCGYGAHIGSHRAGSAATIDFEEVRAATNIVKLSVIGVGMSSHAGVAGDMFAALAEKGVNILAISTSEIKISVLIDADYTELAVRTLHTLYGLDKD